MPHPMLALATALGSKSVAALPDPAELGLSPALAGELAAHAAAAGNDQVSTQALAALPAVGGGTAAGMRLFGSRLFGSSEVVSDRAPPTLTEAAAAASGQAAAQAHAQGAAIEAAVRAELTEGAQPDTPWQPAPPAPGPRDRWSGLRVEPARPDDWASGRRWRSLHPENTEPASSGSGPPP